MTNIDTEWHNGFKKKLADGHKLVGAWLMSGSPAIAELISHTGYDYIVIDVEHGSDQPYSLPALLRAIEPSGTHAVVRMASHDRIAIKQALDAGATNLLFPFVESANQAKNIVEASFYPPQGQRGFALMHRASRFATRNKYFARANEELMLIAQLETKNAVSKGLDIANVPGISGVFIGPGDLSVDLDVPGNTQHESVKNAMNNFAHECVTAGVIVGTVMGNNEAATWAFASGYSFVSIGNDLAHIKKRSIEELEAVQNNLSQ